MRGHYDVRHGDKTCKSVVPHDMPREVLKEYVCLLLVDIEAGCAYLSLLYSLEQVIGINERSARGVDYYNAFFHLIYARAIYEVLRLFRQRAVQGDYIALGEKAVEVGVLGTRYVCGVFVIREHSHAEAPAYVDKDSAYLARTDYSHGLAVKVKAGKGIQTEVEVLCPDISLVNASDGAEEHSHGVFGYGVGRIGGNAHDVYFFVSRTQVDVVVARAAQGDKLYPVAVQGVYHVSVERVVDENTYRVISLCQLRRVGVELCLVKFECQSVLAGITLKSLFVIFLCVEKSYPQYLPMKSSLPLSRRTIYAGKPLSYPFPFFSLW